VVIEIKKNCEIRLVVLTAFFLPGFLPTELVQAQEQLNAEPAPNTLESIVITASRQPVSLRDLSASVFVIDNSSLEKVRAVHINEVLVRVPGTWVSRGNGQESSVSLRSPVLSGGGSCGAFQMAQDGIPLRAAGFCNVNQLFESNSEQAEAIEVIRGPGSVLYGANSIHGAINVISPQIRPNFGEVSVEVGPDEYARVRFSQGGIRGAHGFRVDFNGASDGGYKDDSGFGQQKLTFQHGFIGDNGFSIKSSMNYTNLNQETAGYLLGTNAYKKDESFKRVNPNPEAFRDAKSLRLSTRMQWQKGTRQYTLIPYFRKTDMTFLQHYLPGNPLEENGQHSFGLQAMAHGLRGAMDWTLGVDLENTEAFLKESQYSPAVGSAFLVNTIPAGKHYDYTVSAVLKSPYVLLNYQINPDNRWSLGLRYEQLDYDYDNLMIAGRTKDNGTACGFGGCRFNRPYDRSDSFSNVSAKLGWIHDFSNQTQAFVNISRAFRAPDSSEIYKLQNNQSVADLDSEEADNLEVGYRATYETLSFAFSVYHMQKDNVIYQDGSRNNIDNAATKHQGLEFNVGAQLANDWSLTLASSYAQHTYNNDVEGYEGNTMTTAPKVMSAAELSWQIDQERKMELEWVHMGKYFTTDDNTHSYPGHDLVNLRYQADFGRRSYYAIRVTNLLDADYAERADYAFGNERYFVGQPRSVYVNLGTRF
jgi:iron complex outermembrane receptor protein